MPERIAATVIWLLAMGTFAAELQAVTRTWDPAVTAGDWFVGSNWSPAGVPDNSDDVRLTADGNYAVQLQSPTPLLHSEQVRSLTIGARNGTQQLTVSGRVVPFTLSTSQDTQVGPRGIIQLANAALDSDLDNRGELRIDGGSVEAIAENTGLVVVTGDGNQIEQWPANHAAGQLQLDGDAKLVLGKAFMTNVLENDGTIRFDPGAAAAGAELEVKGIAGINSFLPGHLVNRGIFELLAGQGGGNVGHVLEADLQNSGELRIQTDTSVVGKLQNQADGLITFLPGAAAVLVVSTDDQLLNQANATLRVHTSSQWVGELINQANAALELWANAESVSPITLTVPSDWTNHGRVDLGDPAGAAPAADLRLQPASGSLTNASSGVLHLHPADTSTSTIAADLQNDGLLAGGGVIDGSLQNSGTLQPQATLEIVGTYEQQGGQLQFNVEGPTAGVDYGQLAVQGDVVLNGVLNVAFAGDYRPPHGQPLSLIEWTGDVLFGMDDFDGKVIEGLPPSATTELTNAGTSYLIAVFYSADFDMDDDVDSDDLLAWQRNFGLATGALPMHGDADGDGDVDEDDFRIWEQQYGVPFSAAPQTETPEPKTLLLTVAAVLSFSIFGPRTPLRLRPRNLWSEA